MTAKDYLMQVRKMDKRLTIEREKLDKLRSAVEYRSPSFESTGGHGTGKSAALDKLLDFEAKYDRMAAEYLDLYEQVDEEVKAVDGGVLSEILERKYLLYQNFGEIAAAMNYTERHITRLHGQALQKMSVNVLECPV